MDTLRKLRRYAVSAAYVLVTIVVINSLSVAADPGKNGKIAFIANLTGTNQIYTINPDGTDLLQVTDLPPANDPFALAPDFSPDGKRILFPHDMTGALELYTINADGSGLTQITHDGLFHAAPRWSPDGTHIVFATGGKYGLLVIATIRSDGTDMKILTTPVWESLGASYTPDGKHIVFSSQKEGLISFVTSPQVAMSISTRGPGLTPGPMAKIREGGSDPHATNTTCLLARFAAARQMLHVHKLNC